MMTKHPAIEVLLAMAGRVDRSSIEDASALIAGAAALEALQGLRPHTPASVVGDRYAVLTVGWHELKAAQEVIGDHALPRFDLEAARLAHNEDRVAHYRGMDRDEVRAKWGK